MISSNKDLQKLLSNVFNGSFLILFTPHPQVSIFIKSDVSGMIFKVKHSIKFQVLLIRLSHPNYFRNRDSFEVKFGLNSTLPSIENTSACMLTKLIAFYNTLFMFNEKKKYIASAIYDMLHLLAHHL